MTAALLIGTAAQAQTFPELKLTASDGDFRDFFGFSVAVSGDTVIVGAPASDDNGAGAGAAYLFDADGTETKLTANDGAAGDGFGWSVALSGTTALIGAPFDGDNGEFSGSAYLFDADGSVEKLTASDGEAGDQFGSSVALSDAAALVGSPFDDD